MESYLHPSPAVKDSFVDPEAAREGSRASEAMSTSGALVIVNADDWGRDVPTTDRSLDCLLRGAVSSTSAMVFMEDSERAADLALRHAIDTGLHLNFTMPFSAPACASRLMEHQGRLARFLRSHRLAPMVNHPGLAASFDYVVKAQLEEYERLYGVAASRVDGHHHMHLCANVVAGRLVPSGTVVRRNLTFGPGEKGYLNRLYRRRQDRQLARRHRMTDYFFDLQPLQPTLRFQKIFELAVRFNVEIETHPIRNDEYRFLVNNELARCGEVEIAGGYRLRSLASVAGSRRVA